MYNTKFELEWTDEPCCEHCMNLEPYDPVWIDEGIQWCSNCVSCSESSNRPSAKEVDSAIKEARLWKIEYFAERIHALTTEIYNAS